MIFIPVILVAAMLLSLSAATILEGPTNRGTVYSLFMIIVMLGLFLAPPVSIVLSIIAIFFAGKAIKEGNTKSVKIMIVGIIELLLSAGGIILAIVIIVAGKGV